MLVVMLSQDIAAGVALPDASVMQVEPKEASRASRSSTATEPSPLMSAAHSADSWPLTTCEGKKRCG